MLKQQVAGPSRLAALVGTLVTGTVPVGLVQSTTLQNSTQTGAVSGSASKCLIPAPLLPGSMYATLCGMSHSCVVLGCRLSVSYLWLSCGAAKCSGASCCVLQDSCTCWNVSALP